ncbi:MAG: ATP-binding domain-containing protein [Pseudomonadota bacterium]
MAHINPSGWREVAVSGAALREIETLTLLEHALPDAYRVLHGVHWTRIEHGFAAYDQIDFIIIAPNGRVLLVEQKTGFLQETADGLIKNYNGRHRNVRTEILRTIAQLRARFERSGATLSIDYLLYCPDYRVENLATAGIDQSRIVDAAKRDHLLQAITKILPLTPMTADYKTVSRFFSDTLNLKPDPSAMIGQATALVTRLSGGLATWARQLDFSPYRLRVVGTAGSGKTQLALAEFQAALDQGKLPLYVCYNRPLADHFQQLVPEGGRVATFHVLCDSFAREHGTLPDYHSPGVWQALENLLGHAEIPTHWQYDVVIVDEGQDFTESWKDVVLRLLRPEGRAIWLEDPMQNLYGQAPLRMAGWVTLNALTNYRSPRQIVDMLVRLGQPAQPIEAASPFLGEEVEMLTYPAGAADAMLEKTKQAITQCLGAGFSRNDIAILSFRGREKSTLLNLDVLGKHTLHSFTGSYDLFGKPMFRTGDLLAESIYRFKGQAAPAVIFTEIDFEEFDERTFRKLFVGMTRASLKLILVLSENAAKILHARLQE